MKLGKLQGYDIETKQYSVGGVVENLPKEPFVVASSLDSDYDDVSDNMEYWDEIAVDLINDNIVGFKDWLCVRSQIMSLIFAITGSNFSNWDDLTSPQKIIALKYVPTKIINALGSTFFMTQAGGMYQGKAYLDSYQTNAETARSKRMKTFGDFGYYGLGKDQGLQLERMYQVLALNESYVIRGVMYLIEDSVDGIGDWVMGTNGFGATGLKPMLNAQTFNLLEGFPYTIDQFCAILATNILQDGNY